MTEHAFDDRAFDDRAFDDRAFDDRPDDDRADDRMDEPDTTDAQLFEDTDAQSFRDRWQQVQSRFVDDPRGAVADADALVSDVTQTLTSRFADQRSGLERQWSEGEDVQTEDLRQTMQRYRTLFERLLAA